MGFIWVVVKIMVPFWGTLNIRCRIIIGIQKGTIILTTTYMCNQKSHPVPALMVAMALKPGLRTKLAHGRNKPGGGIAKYLEENKCREVVVMCGAGLSTAAGTLGHVRRAG